MIHGEKWIEKMQKFWEQFPNYLGSEGHFTDEIDEITIKLSDDIIEGIPTEYEGIKVNILTNQK